MNDIGKKIIEWQQNCPDGPLYSDLESFIRFRTQVSFEQYQPTTGPHPDFSQRLLAWINNLADSDEQRKLFELVPRIYFFGKEEFDSLFRAAHNEIVTNWLIDLYDIDISAEDAEVRIQNAMRETFFASLTDSGGIADYFHINAPRAQSDRPSLLTWARHARSAIESILQAHSAKQVVIIEDFIGTGSQFIGNDVGQATPMVDTLKLLGENYKILILPLIACEQGLDNIKKSLKKNECASVECKSVLALNEKCFISEQYDQSILEKMSLEELDFFLSIHSLIKRIGTYIPFEHGPFGYGTSRKEGMGSLVVLYTNCSDNTLAVIHEKAGTWKPLFPRRPREAE